MDSRIYVYGKDAKMSLLMNNATKELSLRQNANWVTICTDEETLEKLRNLIDEKLEESRRKKK